MSNPFLAGAGIAEMMPTADLADNSLHQSMTVRLDETGCPMRARALALTLGETRGLLVVLDLVGMPRSHCDVLRASLGERFGIRADDVIIHCTHSHSTPFLEPMEGPHPFFDFVCRQATEAATSAWESLRPARWGHARTHALGLSFNTRKPMPDGGVKFTRDYREGLATGRPIDPRLNIVRIDDERGHPIAGWVRLAAHPACVIFDAPVSAEYPGYLVNAVSERAAGGAPVLFGFGACGDVNCAPMFGTEKDSCNLGHRLADLVTPAFEEIETVPLQRFETGRAELDLPLADPPSIEKLDEEITELEAYISDLDENPELEWVIGVNFKKEWTAEIKKGAARPLLIWAEKVKEALQTGRSFPSSWKTPISAWVLDDLGLVFYGGEPLTELSLAVSARSPLSETVVLAVTNATEGYLGTDDDVRRKGYETYTWPRYGTLEDGHRPFPYALGAGEQMIEGCVELLSGLVE